MSNIHKMSAVFLMPNGDLTLGTVDAEIDGSKAYAIMRYLKVGTQEFKTEKIEIDPFEIQWAPKPFRSGNEMCDCSYQRQIKVPRDADN